MAHRGRPLAALYFYYARYYPALCAGATWYSHRLHNVLSALLLAVPVFFGAFVLFPGGMVWCYIVFHTQPALCFVNCVLLCCSAAEDGLYLARSCGALSQRALRPVLCALPRAAFFSRRAAPRPRTLRRVRVIVESDVLLVEKKRGGGRVRERVGLESEGFPSEKVGEPPVRVICE